MKKLIGFLWLLQVIWLLQITLVYADDDCPTAVEAAESLNPNAYEKCDYSKTGLNGVLHRAFTAKEVSAAGEKSAVENSTLQVASTVDAVKDLLMSGEFSTAQQLQTLRYGLVQKIATECTNGFVVDGERYLPRPTKAMKLELIYHCL